MVKNGTVSKIVYDTVNAKTNGLADEILNPPASETYIIQNAVTMAQWLCFYAKSGCPITIVGDFDADGVFASAGLYVSLKALGADNVRIRLPRRLSEGYGMNAAIVDEIQTGVIVTVDNGIAAVEAVKRAKEKGLVVLIIDHHLPLVGDDGNVILPCADLIVDPHVDDALIAPSGAVTQTTFKDYCGAGLVYKIAAQMGIDETTLAKISAFAAVATVADVVSLTGDNRNIYREGVANIKKRRITPGLQVLVDSLQSENHVTETDIGFKIAPMINAPGRLYDDGAVTALSCVLSVNYSDARAFAERLRVCNETRKQQTSEALKRAEEYMDDNCMVGVNPIIIVDPECPEGLVGLVAGHLKERHNATAIVFTEKDGYLKGSGRGVDGDHLKNILDEVNRKDPSIFKGYGGHAAAAGLAIEKDALCAFSELMSEICQTFVPERKTDPDIEIRAGDLQELAGELKKYAPFGQGNPPLTVKVNNFKLTPFKNEFYSSVGANGIRLFGAGCEAISFSLLKKYIREKFPTELNITGTVSHRYYLGKEKIQIEMEEFEKVVREVKTTSLNNSISSCLRLNGLMA